MEDLREIQAVVVKDPAGLLRETDRRGLSPIAFAAFQAAILADSLTPLLGLLEPQEAGESKIDVLISAVEAVMDSQKLILAGQAEIKSLLASLGSKPRA